MIIDRSIESLVVFSEDDIVNALRKINANKKGVVLCVSTSGKLEGVLTDGDIRRWLVNGGEFDFGTTAVSVANRSFVSATEDIPPQAISKMFSERVTFVPITDDHHHLVAVAWPANASLRIGDRTIGTDEPTYVIAEIGNNHNGSLDLAKRLIDLAADAGADCAKFQMRDMKSLYRESEGGSDASADLGAQYTMDLLTRFQLTTEELLEAFDHCKSRDIQPLCTPWDTESLAVLEDYGMPAYKVASADLTNDDLLKALADTGKTLLCSTGMSTQSEVEAAVSFLKREGAPFVLLHCNSTYPAPYKDVHLAYLDTLKELSGNVVGYSGHERGYHVPIAAVARGAKVIEKHFTVDRSMEGNDHRVSLLPDELAQMISGIRDVELAIGSDRPRTISQGEMMNREVLAKSLVAKREIAVDQIISEADLDSRSPGNGLQPYLRDQLIGKPARRSMAPGDVFFASDIEEAPATARNYSFNRPFGVPVRYHDIAVMAAASNVDLLEIHLSYRDMDMDLDATLGNQEFDATLAVHSPELFAGDHVMDLCSPDEEYRRRSIEELQRVIEITRALKTRFRGSEPVPIIINAGGFSMDGPIATEERSAMYDLVAQSLSVLDTDGVEIIPQTMPPFPWHFGGQRYHNLFIDADDIVAFHRQHGYRICLDVSHSALSVHHQKRSLKSFLEDVAPITRHLHLADAEGVDGEGLQIGKGTVDFAMVADVLSKCAPDASFIPEIWQGHKDQGSGFWRALERLEEWF